MKVLVIGKEGQVAKSLALAADHGFELVTLARPDIDLAVPATIAQALGGLAPDLVVNAAAYTAVDRAESEQELAHAINAQAPGILAQCCARADIPIIHLSTDYVFDGTKQGPYSEADPVAPLGIYGRTKLEGEMRVAAGSARHIILRTAWVFSPYGHNFVKTMLRLAASRPAIDVVADQRGNPTYAPHLAAAILAIARCVRIGGTRGTPWGVYNAAGTGEATWHDLAREVFAQSGRLGGPFAEVRPIITAQYPTPARRPANSRLDCSKLADSFGVRLPGWQVGVAECVTSLSQGTDPALKACA